VGPVRSWTRRGNLGKVAPWSRLNINHANSQVGAKAKYRTDWKVRFCCNVEDGVKNSDKNVLFASKCVLASLILV
jgi:hypothetical protein